MDCIAWQKALIHFALFVVFAQFWRPSVFGFDFFEDFIYQIVWIALDMQIWFEVTNIFFKFCLWGFGSKSASPF